MTHRHGGALIAEGPLVLPFFSYRVAVPREHPELRVEELPRDTR